MHCCCACLAWRGFCIAVARVWQEEQKAAFAAQLKAIIFDPRIRGYGDHCSAGAATGAATGAGAGAGTATGTTAEGAHSIKLAVTTDYAVGVGLFL